MEEGEPLEHPLLNRSIETAQKKVEQQVERASFFRKNKNRNKFGKKNQNKSGKKRFPREEDRPRRRKKPTYGGKGLTKNEDGSPKKYGGPNKPDKKQEKSSKPHYSRGKGRSGRSNWKRGRKSSRSNRKKFSRKK